MAGLEVLVNDFLGGTRTECSPKSVRALRTRLQCTGQANESVRVANAVRILVTCFDRIGDKSDGTITHCDVYSTGVLTTWGHDARVSRVGEVQARRLVGRRNR